MPVVSRSNARTGSTADDNNDRITSTTPITDDDTPKIHSRYTNLTFHPISTLVRNRFLCCRPKANPATRKILTSLFWLLIVITIWIVSVPKRGSGYTDSRSASRRIRQFKGTTTTGGSGGGAINNLKRLGYKARPRFVSYYPHQTDATTYTVRRLRPYPPFERYPSKRTIDITEAERQAQKHLRNSKDYWYGSADPFVEGDCVQQYDWQLTFFPVCNTMHELSNLSNNMRLINNGYWRDVWTMEDFDGSKRVLKTQRYEHDVEDRNFDRHRRDALASERLTASPNVVDIYGFCANSGLFEYGDGGDVGDAIWPRQKGDSKLTTTGRLRIAIDVAKGIADLHNFDKEGQASIAHTDITPGQFVLIDGVYKLNDFNRCRFIRWDRKKNIPCGYRVGNNPGKFRAPEEYRYDEQNEKVDIYSMGNIFYTLLTSVWPFPNFTEEEVWEKVKHGERPFISKKLGNTTNPANIALMEAMKMCHYQNPMDRASARDVLNYLSEELDEITNKKTRK